MKVKSKEMKKYKKLIIVVVSIFLTILLIILLNKDLIFLSGFTLSSGDKIKYSVKNENYVLNNSWIIPLTITIEDINFIGVKYLMNYTLSGYSYPFIEEYSYTFDNISSLGLPPFVRQNMKVGDKIIYRTGGTVTMNYTINRTEVREYLGKRMYVNVIELSYKVSEGTSYSLACYDKFSGLFLESYFRINMTTYDIYGNKIDYQNYLGYTVITYFEK